MNNTVGKKIGLFLVLFLLSLHNAFGEDIYYYDFPKTGTVTLVANGKNHFKVDAGGYEQTIEMTSNFYFEREHKISTGGGSSTTYRGAFTVIGSGLFAAQVNISSNTFYFYPRGNSITINTESHDNGSPSTDSVTFSNLDTLVEPSDYVIWEDVNGGRYKKTICIMPQQRMVLTGASALWETENINITGTVIGSLGRREINVYSSPYPVAATQDGEQYSFEISHEGQYNVIFIFTNVIQQTNFSPAGGPGVILHRYITIPVKLDKTPPAVGVVPPLEAWSRVAPRWSINAGDAVSGLAAAQYEVRYSSEDLRQVDTSQFETLALKDSGVLTPGQQTVTSAGASESGYYYLRALATDAAGNEAEPVISGPYQWDKTPPVFSGPPEALFENGKIRIEWEAAQDAHSGLKATAPYRVEYSLNADFLDGVFPVGTTQDLSILQGVLSIFQGQTVYFRLTAEDQVGNTSQETSSIVVVPELALDSRYEGLDAGDSSVMLVKLQLSLSPQEVKDNFTQLEMMRRHEASGREEAFTLDTGAIPLGANGELLEHSDWKVNEEGKLYYLERIAAASGAGHKSWSYQMTPTPSPFGTVFAPSPVALPNTKAEVSLAVKDLEGNDYGSPAFSVSSEGKIVVLLRVTDLDQDELELVLNRIVKITSGGVEINGYSSLSGKEIGAYSAETGSYQEIPLEVTLSAGMNKITASYTEGADLGARYDSEIKSINFTETNGTYTLVITDGYGQTDGSVGNGILTNPGKPLYFSAVSSSPEEDPVLWDMGDGTGYEGPYVEHSYTQDLEQTTDHVMRTLVITLPGETPVDVEVQIKVQDTREGDLYMSEVWKGDHEVTGVVVVPAGMSLTIYGRVSFRGGPGGGYGQGIVVLGELILEDGAEVRKDPEQGPGWGTLMIHGQAQVGAALIQDAERGLTVGEGALVHVSGATLRKNRFGVHITGSSAVTIHDSVIEDSEIYGVKEETGGRPALTDTRLENNYRDYYSWDGGLLSLEEINSLSGNSGNTEE